MNGERKAMRKRAVYQVVTEVKASPVGVDWLMIMAEKQAPRRQLSPRRQMDDVSIPDGAKREVVHTD